MALPRKNAANRVLDVLPPLHDYQLEAVKLGHHFATSHRVDCQNFGISSPTGTGKSYICLDLLRKLPDWYLITPKIEIITDMLVKLGVNVDNLTESTLEPVMRKYRMFTPTRFRNRLLSGDIDATAIPGAIIDEAHHDEADGYQIIRACLPDTCRFIGTSATFYRGNPRSTAEFRKRWPKIHTAITERDAFARGFLSLPECETIPLVDDDIIEIGTNGEFSITRITAETKSKLRYLFNELKARGLFDKQGKPVRPTVFGIHSSEIIPYMQSDAECAGIKLAFITQETKFKERRELFERCLNCETSLVHINTISEGVDIGNKTAKLRVYVDLCSVMSPLLFMQRFGRNRRPLMPGETQPPLYLCCNRNLERHGYLLDGLLPIEVIKKAQLAFPNVTERSKVRVFGIESLGKLKPTSLRLTNGLTVQVFAVSMMEASVKRQYLALLHPTRALPCWFEKINPKKEDGSLDWGRWELATPPSVLSGFRSDNPSPLTEGQMKYWQRNATKCGLDLTQPIDAKKFQLCAALTNVGASLDE